MDFRQIFVQRYIKKLEENKEHLTDWEKAFLKSIQENLAQQPDLSMHQFNKLKEIAERL